MSLSSAESGSETPTIASLQREVAELRDLITGLTYTLPQQTNSQASHSQVYPPTTVPGEVPSDSLPAISTVSPTLRRKIQEGKYVNLALLLLPNQDSVETRISEFDGSVFHLKDDPRLTRSLTLGEFIQAFGIFKDVHCENNDAKRRQLDGHEQIVIELAALYGGTAHYDYHKLFAARVAAYAERGQHMRWDMKDSRLFSMCSSGRRTRTCNVCHSVTNNTDLCPSLADNMRRQPAKNHSQVLFDRKTNTDVRGRPRILSDGKEICNNYNDFGCTRPRCPFAHICSNCFKKHTKAQCKNSTARD